MQDGREEGGQQPAKWKRGRPRKAPLTKVEEVEKGGQERSQQPAKRKQGRPRKAPLTEVKGVEEGGQGGRREEEGIPLRQIVRGGIKGAGGQGGVT